MLQVLNLEVPKTNSIMVKSGVHITQVEMKEPLNFISKRRVASSPKED